MPPGSMAHVITELIFFLIAQVGEQGDWRGELIVTKGFEAGDGQGRGTERKRESKAEVRVAALRQMQFAGAESESAQPA